MFAQVITELVDYALNAGDNYFLIESVSASFRQNHFFACQFGA